VRKGIAASLLALLGCVGRASMPHRGGDASALANELTQAAKAERQFQVDDNMVGHYGDRGFSRIAALLKDPDPRVRAVAATALFRWNRSASLPFLIALLEDRQTWFPRMTGDVVPATTTPSEFANTMLSGAFLCDIDARSRIRVNEIAAPGAVDRTRQRWYRYHVPFCFVEGEPLLPRYYWYPMAAYFEVPVKTMKEARQSKAVDFRQVLVVNLDVGHRNEPGYRLDETIPVSLVFYNYGTETLWMRFDQQDTRVHQFELRTADGLPVPMTTNYLTPLSRTTPLLQPINGDYAFGIGPWDIDLTKLFSIPGPGVYRFRYAYVPPPDRQAKEYGAVARLKFWNGGEYSDYFEFQVSERTSN
jgi:hypothetical protein